MVKSNGKPKVGFFLGRFDGGFLAATKTEPYFCVHGETEKEAINAGLAAFAAYFSFKQGATVATPRVASRTPFASSAYAADRAARAVVASPEERAFVPTAIVYVAA